MSTDKYICVRSDESNMYFSDSTTHKFKVQLTFPVYLKGKWKVALVHFHATEKGSAKSKADDGLYIYSGLCQESIVYGEERPLLNRLETNSKGR